MTRRRFKILLEREKTGFSVLIPALPGCTTQGETVEECMANAKEAIQLYIESLKEDHQPIPESDFLLEEIEVTV
ncbi:MAG: type II toxin-antitoxin system HicB family antitoxin [Candidatus Omnitrophica bacterium]|nr:type II toxin-antitoxin system HicB family antitoxin [Candidatus Omnitrophota bacterium]